MSLDHITRATPRRRSPPRYRTPHPLWPGQVSALHVLAISPFIITPQGWQRADGIAITGPAPRTLITLEQRGLLRFNFHSLGRRSFARITHKGRAALAKAGRSR